MARPPNRVPTECQREWLEHVKACRARGLSLKAYAEQHGLSLQRFYHWHRRLKVLGFIDSVQTVSFTSVRVQGAPVRAGRQRLHFPNGMVLEWDGNADLALVEKLLGLVRTQR